MSTPRFPTAAAVLKVARSQVGTTEHPSGSNLTPYGRAYGLDGVAWCGIFQWWIFKQAGVDLHKTGISDPQYTPSFRKEAVKAGWKPIAKADIAPGDVLFFDFEPPYGTPGIEHVEIATAHPSQGSVATIGGNTSSGSRGSQDNGGGVFARSRSLNVVVAAVRPPYTAPSAGKVTPRKVIAAGVGAAAAAAGAVGVGVTHAPAPTHPVPTATTTAPRPSITVTRVPAKPTAPATVKRPARHAAPAPLITGPLSYGYTGESVRILQKRLGVDVDGIFGRTTLRHVVNAQRAAHLQADGVTGPATARALGLRYRPA